MEINIRQQRADTTALYRPYLACIRAASSTPAFAISGSTHDAPVGYTVLDKLPATRSSVKTFGCRHRAPSSLFLVMIPPPTHQRFVWATFGRKPYGIPECRFVDCISAPRRCAGRSYFSASPSGRNSPVAHLSIPCEQAACRLCLSLWKDPGGWPRGPSVVLHVFPSMPAAAPS